MRVSAVIVPPREVLNELDSVVRSATSLTEGGGRFRMTRGRAAPSSGEDQLLRLPVPRMHILIATFGHLTRVDSDALAEAMRESVATWERPTLRFSGGSALERPGDRSVWAGLDGDLSRLKDIAKAVPKVAQRLSLFVDRRVFRPALPVGSITDETNAPYLEALVKVLEAFEGTPWTQDSVSLMKGRPEGVELFEEMERLPLAGS
jgi:2'-5' RNA ligase